MAIVVSKKEFVLNFIEEKPTAYKIQQRKEQKITYRQVVEQVTKETGASPATVKYVVESLIGTLVTYMDLGHLVQLGDFGSFKPTITVKAKKTMEEVSFKDVNRLKIRFYPGKAFKEMMEDMSIQSFEPMSPRSEEGEEGEPEDPIV